MTVDKRGEIQLSCHAEDDESKKVDAEKMLLLKRLNLTKRWNKRKMSLKP